MKIQDGETSRVATLIELTTRKSRPSVFRNVCANRSILPAVTESSEGRKSMPESDFTSIFRLRDEVYDQAERDDVPTGSIGRFVEKEEVSLLD